IEVPRRENLRRRLSERDSCLSSELQVALAPAATYRRLLSSPVRGWRVLRRAARAAPASAVMAPIMAVQRVTFGLVATASVSWCFAVALQAIVGISLIATAPSRR